MIAMYYISKLCVNLIRFTVIYDDKITDGFVRTLSKLLYRKKKTVYIALEKRYVFTVDDLDATAPMYEEFLYCIKKYKMNWSINYMNIDFPRYFKYDRVKHLVLIKIQYIQDNIELLD